MSSTRATLAPSLVPEEFVERGADLVVAFEIREMPAIRDRPERRARNRVRDVLRDLDRDEVVFARDNQRGDAQVPVLQRPQDLADSDAEVTRC